MADKLEKQLDIEADLGNLDLVLDTIEEILSGAEAGMKIIKACQLSVEELFVNIANYGYADAKEKPCSINIQAKCDDTKGNARIELRDKGLKFDPFAKEDPDITLKIKDRGVGGMGIYMTKNLMDSWEYKYDNENIVILEKSWNL